MSRDAWCFVMAVSGGGLLGACFETLFPLVFSLSSAAMSLVSLAMIQVIDARERRVAVERERAKWLKIADFYSRLGPKQSDA